MELCISNGKRVIESVEKVPKVMFKECAGIILVCSFEVGAFISGQSGSGVALAHKDGKWSAPVAVTLQGIGAGAVFGAADKNMLIVLNHFTMDKLLEGNGQLKLGGDLGFAAGKTGAGAGADAGISKEQGVGTSFVYTSSQGAFISAKVEGCSIKQNKGFDKVFYGSDDSKAILRGDVKVPPGNKAALVAALHEKIKERAQ